MSDVVDKLHNMEDIRKLQLDNVIINSIYDLQTLRNDIDDKQALIEMVWYLAEHNKQLQHNFEQYIRTHSVPFCVVPKERK